MIIQLKVPDVVVNDGIFPNGLPFADFERCFLALCALRKFLGLHRDFDIKLRELLLDEQRRAEGERWRELQLQLWKDESNAAD